MTFYRLWVHDHRVQGGVLKLDVTPNITPDDRILLDLIVNQIQWVTSPSGNGGLISPSIRLS